MPTEAREGPGLGVRRPQGAGLPEVKTAPPFAELPPCIVRLMIHSFTVLQPSQFLQETAVHLPFS